jgi:hypothetical protein
LVCKQSQLNILEFDEFCNLPEIELKQKATNKNLNIFREILDEAFNVKS